MASEQEKAIQEMWYKLHPEAKRIEDAAQRILEVSTELHLTWREFEKAIERVKGDAYISTPTGGSGGSGGTAVSNASSAMMNVP